MALPSPDPVPDILWWLPEDTETIIVARGPFSGPSDSSWARRRDMSQVLQAIPVGIVLGGAVGAERTVIACVEGSRHFRPPSLLGMMPYQGCHVVVFRPVPGAKPGALTQPLEAQAKQVKAIAGHRVFCFEQKMEADLWRSFLVSPQPDVLLCATDEGFLRTVLDRMRRRGKRRALPEHLSEWKYVDAAARFWAVRHYDRRNAPHDPSSPVTGGPAAGNVPDKQAVGLVVTYDPRRSRRALVRYLSANRNAVRIAAKLWDQSSGGLKPQIRRGAPGVVEISVADNSGSRSLYMFQFVLMAALGHGCYV